MIDKETYAEYPYESDNVSHLLGNRNKIENPRDCEPRESINQEQGETKQYEVIPETQPINDKHTRFRFCGNILCERRKGSSDPSDGNEKAKVLCGEKNDSDHNSRDVQGWLWKEFLT